MTLRGRIKRCRIWLIAAGFAAAGAGLARAVDLGPVAPDADFTAFQITTTLFNTPPGERANFAGHDLTYLDLSNLDFKGALLARSDFYGTDFTAANLSGADLTGTRLDRSVLIRANLSGANLTGATIYRPTIYADEKSTLSDAPKFSGANLTRISVQADLSGADFRGADLTDANFSPLEARPGKGTLTTQPSNILRSCDFSGARMTNADMTRAFLTFSRFTGADVRGAKFNNADLTKADFTGADVSGADFTGADVYDTNFVGARGLETAIGLDHAVNADKARR